MSDRPYVRFVRQPNLSLVEGGIRDAANSSFSRLMPFIPIYPDVLRIRSCILQNSLGRAQAVRYGSALVGGGMGWSGRGRGYDSGLGNGRPLFEKTG